MSITYYCKWILVFLCVVLMGCSQPTLQDIDGKPVRFSDYRGKWIVINYWASWCLPCTMEIPELNAFYSAHKDKDAVVFGVNNDEIPVEQLPARVQRMGILFPTLATDPSRELGIISIPGLPISFLIGPDGRLQKTLMGEQTQKSLEEAMGLKS